MVGWEFNVVFNFNIVSAPLRVCGRLESSVTGRSGAEKPRVVVRGVVEPDYDTLPVMPVTTNNIASGGLVFRKIPSKTEMRSQ